MKPNIKTVFRNYKLKQLEPSVIAQKDWLLSYRELQTIQHRDLAIRWALRVFSMTLSCTLGIYVLQGFRFKGFSLPSSLLTGLAVATVGQVAGLVGVVFKFLFR